MDLSTPFGTFFEDDGRRYQVRCELRIEPAQLRATGQTIEHEPIPADALEVSITGVVYHANKDGSRDRRYTEGVSYGQVTEDLHKVKNSRAQRLAELWDRWHLNGMHAECVHMRETLKGLPTDYDARKGVRCSVTGYEYGRAWLFETVPAEVIDELRAMFGQKS